MVLVHLVFANVQFGAFLNSFFGDYSRFAAGGFIFMAGLGVGAIFRPKAQLPHRRGQIYRRLWGRSFRLIGWQYLVAVAWIGVQFSEGGRDPMTLRQFITGVLSMREGGDLLPLYVVLIAFSPLILELSFRRMGWYVLAAGSIALFIFGRFYPYAIAIDPVGKFPPVLWQLIFIAGLAGGALLPRYDALSLRPKLAIAGAAWMAFALLFWCEYWKTLNLPACPISLVFTKTPLTTAEMLRYLSAIIGLISSTDILWDRIFLSRAVSFAATLGRFSLPVYVVHTFLIEIARLAVSNFSLGPWQWLIAPITLALLWLLAAALQWRTRRTDSAAVDWATWLAGAGVGNQNLPARQIGE